jgi:mono/diheme cytochrome c family protein
MPRPLIYILLLLVALSMLPLAYLALARHTDSELSRIQVVFDMDSQPHSGVQATSIFFPDGRASRLQVPGTVARGELRSDDSFYLGLHGEGEWVPDSPVPVTMELMARGEERYDIFCSACHGYSGYGDGMVHKRALALAEGTWTQPANLISQNICDRPAGELFNIITNGIRNMPAHGAQIPTADRWAIVAYVRALQRAGNGTLSDVPTELRSELQ